MKQIIYGLLVAATAVSVSAFTNAKSVKTGAGEYLFYNTTGVESSDPNDYVFDNRIGAGCNTMISEACSAQWNNSATPALGAHPDGSKVSDEDNQGRYVQGSGL